MTSVLLIDDDDLLRETIQRRLVRKGYTVICAVNGKEGLRLFREHRPDVLITDMVMPEQEGLETLMMLRKELGDTFVIAMSGGFMGDHAGTVLGMARHMGANVALKKPFDFSELLKLIENRMGSAA